MGERSNTLDPDAPRTARAAFRGVGAAALTLLAACAHQAPLGDPTDRTPLAATPEELTGRIDAEAGSVSSLRGKVEIAFEPRAGAAPRSCKGVLAARAPGAAGGGAALYLKGHGALVATLFTLVSDGRSFSLHVPRENVVYTGPFASRGAAVHGVHLDARDLLRALFLEPLGGAPAQVEEQPSVYVVSTGRGGRVERRLWIERRGLAVAREVFYGAGGREELVVERDRWRDADGRRFPGRVRLRDAATGASVTLEVEEVALNPAELPADAFRPGTPAGARVVALGAGGEGT